MSEPVTCGWCGKTSAYPIGWWRASSDIQVCPLCWAKDAASTQIESSELWELDAVIGEYYIRLALNYLPPKTFHLIDLVRLREIPGQVILSLVVYGRFLEKPAAWALLYECGKLMQDVSGPSAGLLIATRNCLRRLRGVLLTEEERNAWRGVPWGLCQIAAHFFCLDDPRYASQALWIVSSLYLENHTAHCYWDTLRTTLLNMLEGRHFPWEG